MEGKILLSINFELARITPLVYYDCANRLAFLSPKDYFLGRYLLEAAAFSIDFKRYSQVVLAFSVIFFIRKLRNTQEQPEQILHRKYGLCEKELRACAKELCGLWQKIDYVEAMSGLKNKYSGKGFLEVAKIRISEKSK